MYKTIELKENQVYSILIENWDEEVTGLFLKENKEWIAFYDNQNDFLLDGIRYIQKKNIDEIIRESDDVFKEKIFSLKGITSSTVQVPFLKESTEDLFIQLEQNETLFHFDTDDEEEMFVGKVIAVFSDSFKFQALNSVGVWDESFICDFSDVSSIAINNDYLNSLELLLNSK